MPSVLFTASAQESLAGIFAYLTGPLSNPQAAKPWPTKSTAPSPCLKDNPNSSRSAPNPVSTGCNAGKPRWAPPTSCSTASKARASSSSASATPAKPIGTSSDAPLIGPGG